MEYWGVPRLLHSMLRLGAIRNRQTKGRTADGHGWTRMGRLSLCPRSSAFIRGSNLQSAIRNPQLARVSSQTQSNLVKPVHASSQHLPKGLAFDRPSPILWCPCQNAQSMVVCRYGGQVDRQDIGNSRILAGQTQSNPVKPFHPGTQRGVGVLEYWASGQT
jgi:hypothetical protein